MSVVVDSPSTEQELIAAAQYAISTCNWTVGECASKWTKKFSKGRTDADFGALVGLSGDQIYQRRRVWECFADVQDQYSSLKWSHFYVAVSWNDSAECLSWAQDNSATVAEMKAWRRMQHGDDMDVESEAALDGDALGPGFGESILHVTPERFGEDDGLGETSDSFEESFSAESAMRASSGDDAGSGYAPFRKDAASPPPGETVEKSGPVGLDPEQAVKRMTAAIERCSRLLTEGTIDGFGDLPEKLRIRFLTAVENLNEKVAGLEHYRV